ncbi:MAG: hypothetical protein JSW43_05590, partial [Gemmatimonadota bacterium]
MGTGSCVLTVPLWSFPSVTAIALGTGCTTTLAVSLWPVSKVAWMTTPPRVLPPTTLPTASSGTVALAGSSELHATGVPGIGV